MGPARFAVDDTAVPDVEKAVAVALQKRTDVAALRRHLEIVDASAELARDKKRPHVDLTASVGLTGLGRHAPPAREPGRTGTIANRRRLRRCLAKPGALRLSDLERRRRHLRSRREPTGQRRGRARPRPWPADRGGGGTARDAHRHRDRDGGAGRDHPKAAPRGEPVDARAAGPAPRGRAGAGATGLSTTFQLTQAQRDLAAAETAELRAATAYRQSWIELERLQEAGMETDTRSLNLGAPAVTVSVEGPRLPDRAPLATSF